MKEEGGATCHWNLFFCFDVTASPALLPMLEEQPARVNPKGLGGRRAVPLAQKKLQCPCDRGRQRKQA